ncbi:MAG: OmpA family protein, partial [Bacteroidota bacterium]
RAGLWTASLTGGASNGAGSSPYQLDPTTLRLGYADAIRDNLSYRIEVGYQARPAAPDAVLADLELDWSIGMDSSLLANAQAAGDSLTLSLDLIHRVGLNIPRPHGTIGGVVFQDLDGDNRRGAGEPGIAGAWILLDGKRIARTDSEGRWTLQGVGPGAHTIEVECADPNMRVKTGPAAIPLNAGAVVDLAMPVWQATVLTGCVFLDGDGDGLPGEGDAVIPGLPVILSGADGREETVNTARDGTFLFADLAPGPYRLMVAEAGLPPEAESPEPREVIVSQEGYLVLDLPLKEREKPVVFTYTASPRIGVDASPAVAMPGETVRLRVVSDMPLTKVSVSIPGAEPRIHEAHGLEWVGALEIPAGRMPGPLAVAIAAWADGGDPGTAEIELTVVEPLILSASVAPDRVQPGGRVILEVGANQPLVAILVAVGGKEILLNPRERAGRNLLVLPAHLPAGPAVLRVKARSRTGIEAERELVVLVDPGLAITALKLCPFDSGSSAVKPEFRPVIAKLAEILKANPALNLMIVGHADASGTIAANDGLSWERAENVRRILIEEYGVDAGRLKAVGRGSREPIGDNASAQGRELNRRVEFIPLL